MINVIDEPLVSICTPCYNHEKYLQDYLESIINQTYENIEIIIIDDCSVDSSSLIIERELPKLKKRFKSVIYLKNSRNLGIPENCNQILSYVKGKYIKWIASDDVMLENCIEENVTYLESHPSIAMCHSKAFRVPNHYHYGDDYKKHPIYVETIYKHSLKWERMTTFERLLHSNFIITPTIMIRSDIYKQYGGFDTNFYYEDVEFFTRISMQENIMCINKSLVCYRESDTSISNTWIGSKEKREENFYIKYHDNVKLYKKYFQYITKRKRDQLLEKLYLRYFVLALKSRLFKEANYMFHKLKKEKLVELCIEYCGRLYKKG